MKNAYCCILEYFLTVQEKITIAVCNFMKILNTIYPNATLAIESYNQLGDHKSVIVWFTDLSYILESRLDHSAEEIIDEQR